MFDKLRLLKEDGYVPNIILDIGAYKGFWTKEMMKIYSNSEYYLFDGIDYNELNTLENIGNVNIYKNIILNDEYKIVDWYQKKNSGDSIFKENTKYFKDCKPIKKESIDLNTFLKDKKINLNDKNIFIKIDCQGSEINILKGATSILQDTDFILIEMPLFGKYNEGVGDFYTHIKFMEEYNFIPFDKVDNHYINKFNMQIDMLFINKNSDYYKIYNSKPIIYSTLLSNFDRSHVVNYIKEKKKYNSNYKVIDIGCGAKYTSWSHGVVDFIVDIENHTNNKFNKIKFFKLNINFESDWEVLYKFVIENGKFDFCICSHIIEDISLPQVLLNNLKKISKEGFIGIPSKYRELSVIEGNYLGYIHHRWIYSINNNELIGYPKLNFIDKEKNLCAIGNKSKNLLDLSFFWKNDIKYSIINDNYMGPDIKSVKSYYSKLLDDDINNLKYEIDKYTFINK